MAFSFQHTFGGNLAKSDSLNISRSTLADKSKESIATQTDTFAKKEKKQNEKWFELDVNSIVQDSISNLIGGVLFALLLFGLNEYVFGQINLTGEWNTTNKTTKTTYNPYSGMSVEYKIHLLQLGTQISGRGEKTKDLKADGSLHYEYPPEKRVELEIKGHFKRNYLSRSKLYLLIKEEGTKRNSSTSIVLTIPIFKRTELNGDFISTAANSRGTSVWSKIG